MSIIRKMVIISFITTYSVHILRSTTIRKNVNKIKVESNLKSALTVDLVLKVP